MIESNLSYKAGRKCELRFFGQETPADARHRMYSVIKRGTLVWIWIMHEEAEAEMVVLEQIGVSIIWKRFYIHQQQFVWLSIFNTVW